MALGSITIDLLLKTGAFNNDAKLAERRLKDLGATAKATGTAIGVAFAGAVGVAANSIRNAVNRMDDLSKAAQRAQLPTEEFSQLAYAGELADVAMGDIVSSMGRLARAQSDALGGSKQQAAAFRALGIEISGADGRMRSTQQVFMDFADAFQQHKGSPEIMALGMQLFGRSFQTLIPLLKDGREGLQAASDEADRLGVTLSTEAGASAEEFNDNMTRLQKSVQGMWQAVAVELMPDLLRFSELLNSQGFRDGFQTIISGAVNAARTLAEFATTTAGVMNFLGEEVAARIHGAASDDIVRLEQQRDRILKQLSAAQSFGGAVTGITDAARKAIGLPTTDELRAELGRIYRDIDAYQPPKPFKALEAPAFTPSGGIDVDWGGKGAASSNAAAKAAAEALREFERAQAEAAKQAREFTDAQDDARMMLEDMRAEAEGPAAVALLKYARLEQELGLLMAENVLTFTQYADAMQLVHDAREKEIASIANQGEKVKDEMTVFAEQAQRNMQSWLGDSLYNGLSGKFDGIADAFSDMLKRMVAEMMSSKILEFFMGNNQTGQGGLMGLFSGGWGYAAGGYTGPGGRNQPAGVVHKGEVVWSQHDIARAGGVGVVEAMRKGHRGYASGGVVGGSVPIPASGIAVQIVNNGPPIKSESTSVEQQADGSMLLKMVVGLVADDMANGGRTAQAAKGRFGLREAV